MNLKLVTAAVALAASGLGYSQSASAHGVDIIGNATSVELTSFDALTGLGLSVSGLGTATIDIPGAFPVATFAITGGSLDPNTGFATIEHDGSGLALSDGTSVVSLENFLIDTGAGVLSGDVSLNDQFVANLELFNIGDGLELSLTGGAADALNGIYGTALPAGLEIGIASVDVAVVPVPAALPLMLSAMAGLGLTGWRRKTA
ncbi:MAG: hypothetical protein AAFU65_09630 [Pseudomonadota bacterium]